MLSKSCNVEGVNVDLHVVCEPRTMAERVQRLKSSGDYDIVIDASPASLSKSLALVPREFAEYVKKYVCVVNGSAPRHWQDVVVPFLDRAIFSAMPPPSAASSASEIVGQKGLRIAVVAPAPYKMPTRRLCLDDAYVSECCAYSLIGAPSRGGECGRTVVNLAPEGFSHVLTKVSRPDWRACELPPKYGKCVAVVVPERSRAWFFKINGCALAGPPLPMEGAPKRAAHCVFECAYNPLTEDIVAYDCAVALGCCQRALPHHKRIADGVEACKGWMLGSDRKRAIRFADFSPGTVDGDAAPRVLFVRDAAPLSVGVVGDALQWKPPTLDAGQCVMTCRSGGCYAAVAYGECFLEKVGNLENPEGAVLAHMGTYVCRRTSSRDSVWYAEREAKACERLFTSDECKQAVPPATQITRRGMQRLLDQLTNPQKKVVPEPAKRASKKK